LGSGVLQLNIFSTIYAWYSGLNILGLGGPPPPPADGEIVLVTQEDQVVAVQSFDYGVREYFSDGDHFLGSYLESAFAKISLPSFTIVETYAALGEALPEDYRYTELNPSNGTEVLYSKVIGTIRIEPFRAVEGIYVIGLDGENNRTIRKASYD
jgi:hypothetical protein